MKTPLTMELFPIIEFSSRDCETCELLPTIEFLIIQFEIKHPASIVVYGPITEFSITASLEIKTGLFITTFG